MRNLKKLLAVVVALVMVITLAVPAFAADAAATVKTDADVCKDLGMILGSGSGVTADYLATQPTRLQGAIMFLRLKGLEGAAKAYLGTDNFADVAGLNADNTAILAYLKATPDLGYDGVGDNKFDPNGKMTAKQYYKVLLVALGYKFGTDATADFTWANVFSFAATKGLNKLIDNETFTINDLAIGTVEGLKVNPKGATTTLLATLVAANTVASDKAVASGLYTVPVVALAVESVTADNLKSFTIKFNKEIDGDTLDVAVKNGSADVAVTTSVLDDKKTVVGYYTTAANISDTYDFTISAKTADGLEVKDYKASKLVTDLARPVFTGATAINPKQIVLQFSEPVMAVYGNYTLLNDIKVDAKAAIAKTTLDAVKNTITLTFSTALAEGTHKVEVAKVRDFANQVADTASFDVAVVKDAAAPKVLTAEIKSKDEILVTFDESLASNGSFEVNDVAVTPAAGADDKHLKLTGLNLGISAIVEVKVEYKGQKDVVGNEVKDWTTITCKTTDDTTLPTATLTSVGSDNKVTITFSKEMLAATGTVKVLDKDGKEKKSFTVPAFKDDSDNKILELSATDLLLNSVDPSDWSVKLTGMKDASIRGNGMADTTLAIKANDTKKPTVTTKYLVSQGKKSDGTLDAEKDTITIYFSEAMDVASIENLANYVIDIDGAANPANSDKPLTAVSDATGAKAASDAKSVVITYKGAFGFVNQEIKAVAVKDANGNMIAGAISPVVSKQTVTKLNFVSAKAVDANTIEVTFDSAISSVDPALLVVYEGTSAKTGFSNAEIKSTNTVVKFTTIEALDPDTAKYSLKINAPSVIKNVYGSGLTHAVGTPAVETAFAASDVLAASVTDGIKPALSKVEAGAAPNSIKLTFTEEVTTGNIATALLIKDGDGNILTNATYGTATDKLVSHVAGTKEVTVTFGGALLTEIKALGDAGATEKTLKVSFPVPAGIVDANANNIDPIVDTEAKINVALVATVPAAGLTNSTTALVISFSDALYVGGTASVSGSLLAQFTVVDADADTPAISVTSATYDSAAKTITLVIANAETGDTITMAGITDQNGYAIASGAYDVATLGTTGAWALN